MLTKIEALNYRALHYVSQQLSPFQVLIGPNASGKSTFLDVVAFMADLVNEKSVTGAVRSRTPDIRDLTWMRESNWFELAIEADIPEYLKSKYKSLRYEARIGVDESLNEIAILVESLWFISNGRGNHQNLNGSMPMFPTAATMPKSGRITRPSNSKAPDGWLKIVSKTEQGSDYFHAENSDWKNQFRLGPKRSTLANLPEDETRFAVSTWFKQYIAEGVQRIVLNSEKLRLPTPPQSSLTFLPDGSNLPEVINALEKSHPDKLQQWLEHIRTALPDIRSVRTILRPEDQHRYLVVEYDTGLQLPSWGVSDGTLRMFALSILAYLPDLNGIYLIEEPENGMYPRIMETVLQSLNSVYNAQILLATHSPVVLGLVEPKNLLCFARDEQGQTAIVAGHRHPKLQEWRGQVSLSTLYASGVLG
jgi:AAA15 family ATPase/GTPase